MAASTTEETKVSKKCESCGGTDVTVRKSGLVVCNDKECLHINRTGLKED